MRVLVATVAILVAAAAPAPAAAAILRGSDGADRLLGTAGRDAAYGRAGRDLVDGRRGPDFLHGGDDADLLLGGAGPDRIVAALDGAPDQVRCGPGRDLVAAELVDAVAPDCELVVRQLSRDTSTDASAQHETQVEPDSMAAGRTVVVAFQSGRHVQGGAAAIGWATSTDAGTTWRAGFLPGLTLFSTPAGTSDVASDPVVAWDAAHRTWIVVTLGVTQAGTTLMVSRSLDGTRWELPVTALTAGDEAIDKQWATCDNGARSPFRGRCYVAYLDVAAGQIAVIRSTDGGRTWSAPVGSRAGVGVRGILNGAQPAVLPDGTLVVLFSLFGVFADAGSDGMLAMRSRDGGASFEPAAPVAQLLSEEVSGVRAPPFASVEVDASGRVWTAWQDCRHRPECGANELVLASSGDGLTWSAPARVPVGTREGVDAFVPGLAVDPTRAGRRARLAIVYHTIAQPGDCPPDECRAVDVWLVRSEDGGRTWTPPLRLTPRAIRLPWIAQTGLGRMLGDYVSASWAGGRAVAVFALADEPARDRFRQAVFAAAVEG
ncbi:MAG TPA: hypothetical protein VLB86_01420 [Gaiellaceae bacterium]|nr:hypothetical protein [Gaiellaceae bacterium]